MIQNININIDNKVYSENTIKVSNGAVFKDITLLSKHFTNKPNGESILISPKVLIINSDRLQSTNNIGHLLKESFEKNQPLVILLNQTDQNQVGQEILAGIQKGLKVTVITSKAGGKKLEEDLYTLSRAFNSPVINDSNFDNIASIIPNLSQLITLDKVTADSDKVNFQGDFNPEAVLELEEELKVETDLEKRAKLNTKLDTLKGKNVEIGLAAEDSAELYILQSKLDDCIKHIRSCL